jgi:hypothetical protein
MPEGANIEIAHRLHETSEKLKEEEQKHSVLLEFSEAIVLAVVAILTAWSGYQAARWDGRNALLYGEANKDRVLATQASTQGGQYQLFDATTFNAWLQATTEHNAPLAAFYVKRFSAPYTVAFHAWLKTNPFHNPNAPAGPAYMPQYHNPQLMQAEALNNQASATFEQGTSARETADDYVRATVLLATVLFLVALSQRFKDTRIRAALLLFGTVLVAFGVAEIATYPVA